MRGLLKVNWDWVGKKGLCHDGGNKNGEKQLDSGTIRM